MVTYIKEVTVSYLSIISIETFKNTPILCKFKAYMRLLQTFTRGIAKVNACGGGNSNLPAKKTSLKHNLPTKNAFQAFQR